jgi:2-polyprenyl-6-hydroxyphenyl methylase / 3-demethylubiquinone-9 3-methyltransferase
MTGEWSNADAAELAKFDALADRWWDPLGPLRTLHEINPLRLAYVKARVALPGARVLDVGCGGGVFAEAIAREGAAVVGIDLAGASLTAARNHAELERLEIQYLQSDAAAHAEQSPCAYDVVTCMELLEHVPVPEALVAACARAVKPGGTVFFSTINRTPRSFVLAIVAAEYMLDLVPRGTHEYAKLIRPSELAAWCRKSSLDLKDITGMQFNPVTRAHRLGGGTAVNYLCHAVRSLSP